MLPLIHQVANEYKVSLQQLYGSELAEVILFGSHARGDYGEDSDVDFAIILRNPNTRTAQEILKTSVISLGLSLKYGIMLSSLPVPLHKKETSMQGIYQDICKGGIII